MRKKDFKRRKDIEEARKTNVNEDDEDDKKK